MQKLVLLKKKQMDEVKHLPGSPTNLSTIPTILRSASSQRPKSLRWTDTHQKICNSTTVGVGSVGGEKYHQEISSGTVQILQETTIKQMRLENGIKELYEEACTDTGKLHDYNVVLDGLLSNLKAFTSLLKN